MLARLVPCCLQVLNKLLTTCNKLFDIIRLVPRLFQGCSVTTLRRQPCKQSCYIMTVLDLLEQPCHKCVNTVLTSLIMPSSLLKVAHNLFQTCYNKLRQAVRTQLVRTDLLQLVCRLVTTCAFLRVLLVHKLLICFAHLFRNPDMALREKSTSADLCNVDCKFLVLDQKRATRFCNRIAS